jgi:hypothetical protein
MTRGAGRPADPRREAIMRKFEITRRQNRERLTPALLEQLENCKSDTARRLLLGRPPKKERDGRVCDPQ